MRGGSSSGRTSVGNLGKVVVCLAVFGMAATACTQVTSPKAGEKDTDVTVIRVVDGDTIVANVSGAETKVRLLNIDTPETKAKDRPVQCLGNEATKFTKSLLHPGDKITLEYDVTRLDQYGRTLAGVYKDGSLVNADIAAAGLGVAVLFEPNERFYAEVLAAQEEAEQDSVGLFASNLDCTVPAMAEAAVERLTELSDSIPATAEGIDSSLAIVVAAIAAGTSTSATLRALTGSTEVAASAVWAAKQGTYSPLISDGMERATTIKNKLSAKQTALVQVKKEKAAAAAAQAKAEAEAKARAVAQAEVERKAVAKAVAEREAAAQRAAEREAAEARAAERSRRAAPPTTYREPVKEKKDSGTGSYPGYTGPRCYAPGGQSWKPCK